MSDDQPWARGKLRHEAHRLAVLIWWGRYSVGDALVEMRSWARLYCVLAGRSHPHLDDVADKLLRDAIICQRESHTDNLDALVQAAQAAIAAGGNLAQTQAAVIDTAATRPLPVPPHLLHQALDEAVANKRRSEAWWRKREMMLP